MRILISGATGLVGEELFMTLYKQGHDVVRLVRTVGELSGRDIIWDTNTASAELSYFEGFDAIVHLAGENIASGRWTPKKKARIRDSRVIGTKNLTKILVGLKNPPKVFVVASAIGFYGDRGDEVLDEQSAPGTGFLAETCKEWEEASQPAAQKGIRTVNLRFGMILSPKGGALKKMLPPFKLGLGGMLGSGKQYVSWIALEDVIGIIEKSISDEKISGPVNAVSPEAVTNSVFTQTLGDVLLRPTILPMPVFAARLVFGEMTDALLLSSQRVAPKKLQAAGYEFALPKLDGALKKLLSR